MVKWNNFINNLNNKETFGKRSIATLSFNFGFERTTSTLEYLR